MKLYGKELDAELLKRKQIKQARIDQRISAHNAARSKGIDPAELLAFEYGYDCCPHEEWKDSSDFHFNFVFKVCKKCGMTRNGSMEKVDDSNMNRAYDVFKTVASKISEKDNRGLVEK